MKLLSIGIVLALSVVIVQAQEETPPPAFDVASIKPHVFGGSSIRCGPTSISGSHVTFACSSLRKLILRAYGIKPYQISGGPSWLQEIGDTAYDIAAVAPGTSPPTIEQANEMLKALLATRFQLKIHRETKELPIYSLVLAKERPKMKPSAADARIGMTFRVGGYVGSMKAAQESMPQLALYLSDQLNRPVFDKTGLTGSYEVRPAGIRVNQRCILVNHRSVCVNQRCTLMGRK